MIVNDKGDLYVKLRKQGEDGAIAAIRDANKDGTDNDNTFDGGSSGGSGYPGADGGY